MAIDAPMSWFPDGKRLAYVDLIARNAVPKSGVGIEVFGQGSYTGNWAELPAIHVLDITTGKVLFLSLGWQPVVSANGKTVLVGGWVPKTEGGIRFVWKRVDVATAAVTDATWPGDAGGLIASPTDGLVLYR